MKKKQTTLRKLMLGLAAFSIIGAISLLVGELAVRAIIYLKSKTYPTQTTRIIEGLGWETKRNFTFSGQVPDASGHLYALDYHTDDLGFRAFDQDDSKKDKNRIFYLGDSFTQAIEVSNDKTFYGLIDKQLDAATFAYGCRGYNTLQEYMILDQYYDKIKPEIFVLQFCYNDFINNSIELEANSIYNNNRRIRPYLAEDGDTEYAYPARIPFRWLNDNSMFFQLVFTTIEKVWNNQIHKNLETTEAKISEFNQDYPPFREAIHTTKTLLQKIKTRLDPEVHFLLLHVGGYDDPYYQAIVSICEELCIDFISEVSENTLLNNTEPEVMAKDHFHWNEKGHQIAADALLEYLSPIFGEDFSKISATNVVRPQD